MAPTNRNPSFGIVGLRDHDQADERERSRSTWEGYRRAWLLVHTMNACFRSLFVDVEKGGRRGGGASLTVTGRKVLEE